MVFIPEDATSAEAAALAGLCTILRAPVFSWLPTEDVRQAALQFVLTALAVPLGAGLYVDSFAPGQLLNRYVEPSALKQTLAILRISQLVRE